MIVIAFSVTGNQENPRGNPIPYTRVLKQQMRRDGARYLDWQAYVRTQFVRTAEVIRDDHPFAKIERDRVGGILYIADLGPKRTGAKLLEVLQKPLQVRHHKAYLDLSIAWANRSHGDPDNVRKGIADALFAEDQEVYGSEDGALAVDGCGRIDALLTITEDQV